MFLLETFPLSKTAEFIFDTENSNGRTSTADELGILLRIVDLWVMVNQDVLVKRFTPSKTAEFVFDTENSNDRTSTADELSILLRIVDLWVMVN